MSQSIMIKDQIFVVYNDSYKKNFRARNHNYIFTSMKFSMKFSIQNLKREGKLMTPMII